MSESMTPTLDNIEPDVAQAAASEADAVGTVTPAMNPEFNPDTFSVDNYADRLMDDVFVGVEHLLETGMELPTEKPEPDYVSVKTIKMPEVVLPLSVIPEGALAEPDTEEKTEADEKDAQVQSKDWSFRILCGLALASFAGATAMVATQWQSYRALYFQATGQAVTETVAVAPTPVLSPNAQFATYVQRSLEVLKDQTAINQANGRVVIAPPPAVLQVPPVALPPVANAATPPTAIATAQAAPAKTVVERIYIPVYQTPNGFLPVDPSIQLSQEVAAAGALPAAQPPASLGVPAVPLPRPAVPDAVASAQQSSQSAESAGTLSPEVAPETPIVSSYTLVGLLELGNSSAALVEVNGVTRRLSLGENIGGWSLAEIKDGEAVFRRNGQVRSIFVGQTF